MLRIFISVLGTVIFLLSSPAIADEKAERKAEVKSLYQNYKSSLQAGDADAALKLAEQLYAITPEVYGLESKTYATVVFNLAQINELTYHRKEAAKLYQEHIDVLDKLDTPHDRKYLAKLGLLFGAYLKTSNMKGAVKYASKAFDLSKKLALPAETIAEYELRLGISYYRSYGQYGQARRHINKAFDTFSSTYGKDHTKTARAMFWQAKLNMGYRKNRRAAEKFENVLDIYNKELKPGDDRILQVHAFLVNVYEKLGEKEKSTAHCIAVATERATDFDRDLDPLYKVTPTYPRKALSMRKAGFIVAEFTVDEFGQVKDIKTLGGENIKYFEKNAYEALSNFRYAPTIKDGKRVDTHGVKHKITFEMEK